MDGYGYQYPPMFPPMRPSDAVYPDHGDGAGEYYGMEPLNEGPARRRSRSRHRTRRPRSRSSDSKSRSKRDRSKSQSRSRSRSQSQSRSRSRSRSRSKSHSRSHSRNRSRSGSRHKDLNIKEPGFLDAFRVLYLTPSKHKKNPTKYLATKKRQDRVQEYLKSDGLGSKRWLFYPRNSISNPKIAEPTQSRATCDQRIKIDGEFFRKYRKSKKVDSNAPIAKLKRWELVFYKKLGFVQAV